MRNVFAALIHHVASLSQEGIEALMRARPDVAAALFQDAPDGRDLRIDVDSVAEVLADPNGVAAVMVALSRPEVQVLMALYASADGVEEGIGARFDALVHAAGHVRYTQFNRLLSAYIGEVEVDPKRAREALKATEEDFDPVLDALMNACLIWPQPGRGLWRLHDAVPALLPDPTPEWAGFDPVAPVPDVAGRLPVEQVDAQARAAATGALEASERLLRHVATEKVPLVKTGGVGVRELKRLVRITGLDEQALRFWLHVTESAGLVVGRNGELWATPDYDQWLATEPEQRYTVLFAGWLGMPTSVLGPFAPVDQAGKPPAVLAPPAYDDVGDQARSKTLQLLAAGGAGTVADAGSLAGALAWQAPLIMEAASDGTGCGCAECTGARAGERRSAEDMAAAAVETVLTEGGLIGAVALGAAAPVVRALFPGPGTSMADVADGFASALSATLPQATHQVRIQGDMTVVAVGLPSARLSAFFDATADREAAGAATVWRITDGSVRRWLDDGRTAGDLLAGLAEFCADELPQALRYLVEDAARRHGLVDVVAARAVVVADDARLAAELAVLPSLAGLGVRRLTETVLVLDAAPQEVLSALRFAGYLPSAHEADGTPSAFAVARPRAAGEPIRWA